MKRFVLAALAVAGLAVPGVHASTLSGDKIDISYYYPTRTSLYLDQGLFNDPSPRIAIPKDPKGYGNLYPSYFRYVFGQANTFTVAPFDGIVFTDETSSIIAKAVFDSRTTVTDLSASDLSFTSNSISLNLSGVNVQAGQVIEIGISTIVPKTVARFAAAGGVPTVPLPAGAPLFGGALVILGAVGYGLKRKSSVAS